MHCKSPLDTAHLDRVLQTMGVGPCGWCTVVVGSCCSWNLQNSPVSLLHLCGNIRDLWYAFMCVFLCDDRCVLAQSGALACLTVLLCSVQVWGNWKSGLASCVFCSSISCPLVCLAFYLSRKVVGGPQQCPILVPPDFPGSYHVF